jgi:hypothetical protein
MSALANFKKLLKPGAKLTVTFEPTRIVGNVETIQIPGKTEKRTVSRATDHRVYFENPDKTTSLLDLPTSDDIVQNGNAFTITLNARVHATYEFEFITL